MYVIGECLNGMFMKVRNWINDREKAPIQELAKEQVAAGANALDLNVGPVAGDPGDAMIWLGQTVREVTDVPLWIDSPKWSVMQKAVPAIPGKKALNSTKADEEALNKFMTLAKEHNAGLITLTIDKSGVPADVDKRVELGAQILAKAAEFGMPHEDLFIDPIILPVNASPDTPKNVLAAIQQLAMFSDPSPQLLLGLSNVSQKCSNSHLINRTYLVMTITAGLSAAILDPMDKDLMDAMITAELMKGKAIYCDGFLEAYRMRSK
jgi:5-methyltetrahydrofolate corrinoid/iron sulfur protein methyltransferase